MGRLRKERSLFQPKAERLLFRYKALFVKKGSWKIMATLDGYYEVHKKAIGVLSS